MNSGIVDKVPQQHTETCAGCITECIGTANDEESNLGGLEIGLIYKNIS